VDVPRDANMARVFPYSGEARCNNSQTTILRLLYRCFTLLPTVVVDHTIVADPTIRQPGFDSLAIHGVLCLNCFRTGQDPRRASLHKWGLAQSPSCDCGQRQTTNHIVNTFPLTKFKGGLNLLHEADDDAVIWLESTATSALAK